MSIAPHTGIVDFGTFTAPTVSGDGIQGEVPQPLAGQETHLLSASGWVPASSGSGTVTSVAASVPTGLSISGSPITTSGTLAISYSVGYAIPTTASQTTWDTAYTDRLKWDGGASGLVAATGRTSLGLVIGTDVLAPNGSAASLTSFPTLNQNTTGTASNVTGIVALANGGTGTATPSLVAGTNVSITGTFPNQTINASSSSGTVTSVGGTGTVNGITLTGTVTSSGNLTLGGALSGVSLTTQVTDTLPVANGGTGTATPSLVAGTNISITGTFPNQTINASASGAGTVTSVDVSGGTTGLTTSGGPVTTSGTITIAGTLHVDHGGTGQTTYTNGQLLIGNTTGNTLAKATLTQGVGVAITNGNGTITIAGALAESTSVFTSGTAQTYTAPANTQWVKITVVGPGGNGGAANNQRATGGAGGGVAYKWLIMNAGQTLTYTVGTVATVASTVSSGTLTITTITANSGASGAGTAYAASVTAGPAGGTASGGDVNIIGGRGASSFGSSTTVITNFSGKGGDCPGFGTGGLAVGCVATAGTPGNGFGAGAGGSHGNNTIVAGNGGIIIFEAY